MPGPMELKNKRILVVGVARTGMATALFCSARGAVVTATDSRAEAEIGGDAAKLREAGVTLEFGGDQMPGPADVSATVDQHVRTHAALPSCRCSFVDSSCAADEHC